jgi:hypothetical protein
VNPLYGTWEHVQRLPAAQFTCGFCGSFIASETGWQPNAYNERTFIRICPACNRPTFRESDGFTAQQVPGVPFGSWVTNINNESIANLYAEARKCTSVGAYTAAVLACRKILLTFHEVMDTQGSHGP